MNTNIEIASWDFILTKFTVVALLTVNIVSFSVHFYSLEYMKSDPAVNKFIAYLSLFTFFMIVFITSTNILVLFLGWEGIGFCSFLLIGFWSTRRKAVSASIKALFLNRLGDFFILMAICLSACYLKTCDTVLIGLLAPYFKLCVFTYYKLNLLDVLSLFLVFGAIVKSAQLGLHLWLPDAMEGPTPVSALIHAATMVTAGVILILKFSALIDMSSVSLIILSLLGSLTALFSGLMALGQWDLKKIIAFSTCSQLGYMILACGSSIYVASLFHLVSHAFFKAALFLLAGNIIHSVGGEQDIRKINFFDKSSNFILVCFLIASMALSGFPFFSGYYSKDLIIHSLYIKSDQNLLYWSLFFILVLATLVTVCYSLRVFYYLYYSEKFNSINYSFLNSSEESNKKKLFKKNFEFGRMSLATKAVVPLVLASLFFGFFFNNFFLTGSSFFDNEFSSSAILSEKLYNFSEFVSYELDFFIIFLTYFFSIYCLINFKEFDIIKIIVIDYFYSFKFYFPFILKYLDKLNAYKFKKLRTLTYGGGYKLFSLIFSVLNLKFFLDGLYAYFRHFISYFFLVVFTSVDKGLTHVGSRILVDYFYVLAFKFDKMQTESLQHYLSVSIFSVILFISFLFV